MRNFLYRLPRHALACFTPQNLVWQILGALLTLALVRSGFDAAYFDFFLVTTLRRKLFSAAIVGFLVPFLLPLALYILGRARRSWPTLRAGFAVGQAALLGYLISIVYKFFTGRAHPDYLFGEHTVNASRLFRFGLDRGGIFWGWPSSHTTVAFAMALALVTLYPRRRGVQAAAVLYALYIGVGVSMTIHWFSDFAFGAIVGSIVGIAVGRGFRAMPERSSDGLPSNAIHPGQ